MSGTDRKDEFDVVVIGSGATGQSVAYAAREDGMSVAIVEARTLGGTCPNRGCDAKKVYVNAAEAFEATVRLAGKGLRTNDLSIRWDELLRTKRSFTDPIHDGTADRLRDAGIEAVLGRARFVDPHALDVDGRRLRGDRIVVATGSRPAPVEFPGGERMIDSDAFLELEALPRRVVFVGGGFVSFEFAHVAARAG
ncbi:MAG: FAD-dependent oxidoreductase, partial [Planctomycetota bacterium JB042]